MAKWTFGGAVLVALSLSDVITWVHFALALIATTCAALAAND